MADQFRKPVFWIFFVLISAGLVGTAAHFYPLAFPIISFPIEMDRMGALKQAAEESRAHGWDPKDYQDTASFELDDQAQNFVELAAGGSSAFTQLLKEGLYAPYTWQVRHYQQGNTNEAIVRFTPEGKSYGFSLKIDEKTPGSALNADEAQAIAEKTARTDWKEDLGAYQLAEKSQEKRISGRIDHTFVYERTQAKLGEGRYRLRLVVSGDRLSEVTHFIKIPEAFSRHYAEMRSSNETITVVASVAMLVLYLVGGCGFGIFFLARQKWLIWKTPILFGFIVAAFQFLDGLNKLPLSWMDYDTAISAGGFLAKLLAREFTNFLVEFVLLSVSFMAAESLSRKAFPKHPQLWKIWTRPQASSLQILGRTLGGYLAVGFFFCFVVMMYWFGKVKLGWWNRAEALYEPDVLATYLPWLSSVATSLHAGFWEESLFRAVPLASAALLGQKFGKRKLWIGGAFILQALVFASAHASYLTQPPYARIIELILPSFMFGTVYYFFGLLPGIILHFTFDVTAFAIPLFATRASGIWVDRSLIVLLALVPLWVVLFARFREGRWTQMPKDGLNAGWSPSKTKTPVKTKVARRFISFHPSHSHVALFGLLGLLGLGAWAGIARFRSEAPALGVGRPEAVRIAREALRGKGLSDDWRTLEAVQATPDEEDRFVWQTSGKAIYRALLGRVLAPPMWRVRFVRFEGDVAERADEYQVFVMKSGEVFRIRHELPEGRPGKSLTEAAARQIALDEIKKKFGLESTQVKAVSSQDSKLPARVDWFFVFKDLTQELKEGEVRVGVRIAGDEAQASRRFVFIPEDWSRRERARANVGDLVRGRAFMVMALIFLAGMIAALIRWSRRTLRLDVVRPVLVLLLVLGVLDIGNSFPSRIAEFSTARPWSHQLLSLVAFGVLSFCFLAFWTSLGMGYVASITRPKSKLKLWQSVVIGVSLGLIGVGVSSLASAMYLDRMPFWGSFGGADQWLPSLSGLASVERYLMQATSIALVISLLDGFSDGFSRRRTFTLIMTLLFGLTWMSSVAGEGLQPWLLTGAAVGALFSGAFVFFARDEIQIVPVAVATYSAIVEIREGILGLFPGEQARAVVAVIGILATAFYWHRSLYWRKTSNGA